MGTTYLKQTAVTVGTTAADAAAANPQRKILIISNLSANIVYVNFSATATATNGIRIASNTNLVLDNNVPTGAISAIASSAGSAVVIAENPSNTKADS